MMALWRYHLLSAIVIAVGSPSCLAIEWLPKLLGQTPLHNAAFMGMYFSENAALPYVDRWQLFISTFDALPGLDEVYRMDSPGRYLSNISEWDVTLMDKSAYWPNDPDYIPASIGGSEGVMWASGFLVPGKKEGKLQMYDTTQNPPLGPFNIASNDEKTWSYHHVVWKDMDVDGDLDCLTARFHMSLLGELDRQLVWFENEGRGFSEGWPVHVITTDGADISIATITLSAGGRDYDCVFVSEFFNQKTSIVWTESDTNDWTDLSMVKSRVIAEGNQPFEALVDDFNRDGSLEIMQSEFNTDSEVGTVNVYSVPEDFRTDEFTCEIIATGFVPNSMANAGHNMSPGSIKTFYPSAEYAAELAPDGNPHKPWVLLSGDDDGVMYILWPTSDDRAEWTYDKNVLEDTHETTVGKGVHGDINGDGYEEIIFAGYSVGQLFVYTYNFDL